MAAVEVDFDIGVVRLDRIGIRKVLGDLEAEIMELIWALPPARGATVREVFKVLHARRRIAYTTVMVTMSRLAKKHVLWTERREHARVYYPSLTREEFIGRFVRRILENLFASFSGTTVDCLTTLGDSDAADRLRRLLNESIRRRTGAASTLDNRPGVIVLVDSSHETRQ